MSKLINFFKNNAILLIVLLISVPTFYKMLTFGMYSTQDFHFFRLLEFDKCVRSFQIPCRWSPDAGLGYGEPLFNFYGQFAYGVGEIFHLLGLSIINSLKGLFIVSLAGSAVSMFFLAKKIWKNNYAALISSTLYLFAPYRSVDVWVRGALPEAFSFIFFPLIILSIEEKSWIWFSVLFSMLIITHNLSVVLFLPLLTVWIIYRRSWKMVPGGIISFLITAFYILPVLFESKFIDLGSTINGYFDFHNHFATSFELFVSNFWGYGASVWGPNDGLSLAIGYIQWILPLIIFSALIFKYIKSKDEKFVSHNLSFVILFLLGWFYVFLTHNKSTFIWEHLPFMAFVQFPWRFLGMVVFSFSLAAGYAANLTKKWIAAITLIICIASVTLNFSFFKPDIWYKVGDAYFTTGAEWVRQRTASIGDFWPNFGHKIPTTPSDGKYINYFPGWNYQPDKDGLILSDGAIFSDTPIRRIGNIISLATIIILTVFVFTKKWKERT